MSAQEGTHHPQLSVFMDEEVTVQGHEGPCSGAQLVS